jgi:predicted PurR-regulated permease PerM
MAGAFLVGFFILFVLFFIISRIDKYNESEWGVAVIISLILGIGFLIAIPISRIDSKQNVQYMKIFQETLDYNRSSEKELSVFERATIIEEINKHNSMINAWNVKGQKWYNNKWYYHPDTKDVKFVK